MIIAVERNGCAGTRLHSEFKVSLLSNKQLHPCVVCRLRRMRNVSAFYNDKGLQSYGFSLKHQGENNCIGPEWHLLAYTELRVRARRGSRCYTGVDILDSNCLYCHSFQHGLVCIGAPKCYALSLEPCSVEAHLICHRTFSTTLVRGVLGRLCCLFQSTGGLFTNSRWALRL